jgi:Formyl transferase
MKHFEALFDSLVWENYSREDWALAAGLWATRRQDGFPIVDADLLIAVFSRNRNAILVTDNEKDFAGLGVPIVNWTVPEKSWIDGCSTYLFEMKPRLAILDSGDGANLQAILDACRSGELQAQVTVVVSDERESRALDQAEAAGIPALYHPFDWYRDTGRSPEDYDRAFVELIAPYEPDWIVLIGRAVEPGKALRELNAPRNIDVRHVERRLLIEVIRQAIQPWSSVPTEALLDGILRLRCETPRLLAKMW